MGIKIKPINVKKQLNKINIEFELNKKGYNLYDIAKYYISGFKGFNIDIKSDLRENDKKNSLRTRIQDNKLIISDFGFKTSMSIYDYLMEKYHCSYKQSLNIVRNDFRLDNIAQLDNIKNIKIPEKHYEIIKNTSMAVKIEVKRSRKNHKIHWSKKDIEYWSQYGISIKKLEEKGIAPLDKFWITNFSKSDIRQCFNVINELCYVYPFFRSKEGFFMYKIYMPNGYKGNLNFRWISNVNKKVIQNIEYIPKSGDLLLIQSSYKDIMLLEELNDTLIIIAPNGEGMWFEDYKWEELKKNWKRIVLFGNNDSDKRNNPGLEFARRHSERYHIPFVCTPNNTASDISDYYKAYGKEKTLIFLNKILDNINLIT